MISRRQRIFINPAPHSLSENANIKTDKWRRYRSLGKEFHNLLQIESGKKGNNFPDLHRAIMGFKGWLGGMYHQVEHLQAYIDEYYFRFNRSFMKEGVFENLLVRIITSTSVYYKEIIAYMPNSIK